VEEEEEEEEERRRRRKKKKKKEEEEEVPEEWKPKQNRDGSLKSLNAKYLQSGS